MSQNIQIISKNTEVSTQTGQQIKDNIQTSTASNNHCTIIANAKENAKNQQKLNMNQLNSNTSDKTQVNGNSNNEKREPLDQDDEKYESEEITQQSNPSILHKKDLAQL